MNIDKLPWICEDHPEAQIKRTYDQKQYILNGYPAGVPLKLNIKYECCVCGRELALDNNNE